jgi:hypothetical protein
MRATEFVVEAPLQDYVPLNFTDKGTQFKPVDKKLVQHPVNHTKAIKFFENTPYNFRLFFNDKPGLRAYKEGGIASPEQIQQIFGKDSEQILQNSQDAITIVFIGNSGDQAVMMTPWIMAHRFGHAHAASNRRAYGTNGAGGDPWTKAESYFFKEINGLLENFYSKETYRDQYHSNVRWKLAPEYNALFNAIGTQRSSRENQIKRPYEFLYEMFAQYLKDGQITLNPIPASLDYGRKAWGRPTKYMSLKPEFRDEMTRQEISQELANQLSNLFNIVLRQSVGKIYVM